MQRRNIIAIIAATVATLVVLCLAAAGIGIATFRYFEAREQAAIDDVLEQIEQLELDELPAAGTPPAVVSPAPSSSPPPSASAFASAQASAGSTASGAALPPGDLAAVAASLVPGNQDLLAAHPTAAFYRISARLDPQARTIRGSQDVRYTNAEDVPLSEVYFRLYPNAPHYEAGGIAVAGVRVDGDAADVELLENDTTLKIALPAPLAPGVGVDIAMDFETTIPGAGVGYGIFAESGGIFALYNWHPELAVYEAGGWLLHPIADRGDPTNTDASNYDVRFAAPDGFSVITSGVSAGDETGDGLVTHRSTAALARNFVVVASNRFERAEQQIGDILVRSFYLPEDEWGGHAVLDVTVQSLDVFGKQFGPYPYREMDVAQVDLGGGVAGMEASGLIMIGSAYYSPDEANPLGSGANSWAGGVGGNALAFTTAHEVAHQWWYGVVGNDAYAHPWLDESLTNWSSAYWVDETLGPDAGLFARDLFIGVGYRTALFEGDRRLDQPVDAFSQEDYSAIVYGKGPLMYDVLREELGDEKYFEFLRRWYREQAFDRATNAEWLATLSSVAGRDMTPFYRKWVEGNGITAQDLPEPGPLGSLLSGDLGDIPGAPEASP